MLISVIKLANAQFGFGCAKSMGSIALMDTVGGEYEYIHEYSEPRYKPLLSFIIS